MAPLAAAAVEVVEAVDVVAAAAGVAVDVLVLELLALPHAARTSAQVTTAAIPVARNFIVLRVDIIAPTLKVLRARRFGGSIGKTPEPARSFLRIAARRPRHDRRGSIT
jgi:hypothetical protein